MISVIIPTLNAAASLEATLAGLRPEGDAVLREIIVADGGSRDATTACARKWSCVVVTSGRGRGTQLAQAASGAAGDWLLFLHADTRLEAGWAAPVRAFINDGANADRAAAFTFALDDTAAAARRLERIVAARVRLLALPYGDQGLLVSRRLYETVGGFRPLALMEDVDLVRRIGRRRLAVLPTRAITSAERYRRDGYLRRMARNALCLTLYFGGVPPRRIAGLYG